MISTGTWFHRGGRDFGPAPFLVAGIVNATPDSFSDGGLYAAPHDAEQRIQDVLREGAHIVDIGGESTRPGAAPVSPEEEQRRVLPLVRYAVGLCAAAGAGEGAPEGVPEPACGAGTLGLPVCGPAVSVDTWRAATAAASLEAGASIINDISGGSFDPDMASVLAQYAPGYVLGHCPAPPQTMQAHTAYADVTAHVLSWFETRLNALCRAGLPEDRVVLDPGIGFGKTPEQNVQLLRQVCRLRALGRPLYVGISRKSLFGALLGLPVDQRFLSTQTATALLAARGVLVHRVHDVAATVQTLTLAAALREDSSLPCSSGAAVAAS